MANYVYIDEAYLARMAQTIRSVTGDDSKYTPEEMIQKVTNIMDSAMYLLVDDQGNEVPAVFVENETMFTATANDIRLGKVAASQNGVVTGKKEIPNYRAEQGYVTVKSGNVINIPLFSDMCEYTKLQAIICGYNASIQNSVSAEKVVINDKVYPVSSVTALANVTVDSNTQTIKLGLTNTSGSQIVVRYMIIKEDA